MSDTKFFRRTILLSLRIFPVFSTPRAAFTTARTVNEAVAAAFPPRFFVYRPTTSNSNLAPVVALTLGKEDVSRKRPLSLRRKHCRTNRFFIRHSLPDRFNCSKTKLTRFVFCLSRQVTARARGCRFIYSAKHDTCCLNFTCDIAVPTDISSANAKDKTTPQSISNGKTRYLSVGQGNQTPADRSILSVCDCSRAFKLTPHHAKQRGLDKGGHPICHRKKRWKRQNAIFN